MHACLYYSSVNPIWCGFIITFARCFFAHFAVLRFLEQCAMIVSCTISVQTFFRRTSICEIVECYRSRDAAVAPHVHDQEARAAGGKRRGPPAGAVVGRGSNSSYFGPPPRVKNESFTLAFQGQKRQHLPLLFSRSESSRGSGNLARGF